MNSMLDSQLVTVKILSWILTFLDIYRSILNKIAPAHTNVPEGLRCARIMPQILDIPSWHQRRDSLV
jgi:hypothetical protein